MSSNSNRRVVIGEVISTKMDKTIAVRVERIVAHPLYKKYVRRSSKYLAHDEAGECKEGDVVAIEECRPISRRKSWRLAKVIERAAST
ncbi:MAG: 30S ribosomal protein S17 [Chromatiales bacterium]